MTATASVRASAILILVFAVLVGRGLTGSSLGIGLEQQSGLVSADQERLLGVDRPIRSDEWVVFTPMAIAQYNHEPRFPIVNTNLGPDGQNMLVAGMAGVPVKHISQWAKPATWGFYIFDLRRALAWYWWLPVFGSLFAVWGVMGILAPGRWAVGLGTAATFVSSAYVAAWSNWPAYTVMFPALGFCMFMQIFRSISWPGLLTLGAGLGVSLAGFVFVLYPPWQVSVGYMFLFLTAGVALRDRLWQRLAWPRLVALAVAAVVAAYICWAWWSDARPAIEAMQATVYPGRRTAAPGGGMSAWETFRGFVNNHSLYYEFATLTNQSETSSFVLLFPVVIASVLVGLIHKRRPDWPEAALMLFCVVVLWFQYVGIGPTLAKWTLWGRVQPLRTDIAIGLASILLCGTAVASTRTAAGLRNWEALAISALAAVAALLVVLRTPEGAIGLVPFSMSLLILPFIFLLSYWLIRKNATSFMLGSVFLAGSMSWPFNPLIRAPSEITPVSGILKEARENKQRVLVVGTQIEAMELFAAGVPVASGVFYYPQRSIWRALDPNGENESLTNRYQHMLYNSDSTGTVANYKIETPFPDVVRVFINPERFDFSSVGAQIVLAPTGLDLSGNPSVELASRDPVRSFYRVIPRPEAAKQD
jgi:hypothetical protein